MDILKHSELSAYKFGGIAEDYFEVHKFIDSSKLFYFNIKHRTVLHHTFGVELCINLFGDTIINSNKEIRLIREIAIEHIKEDLDGMIPTLQDWFIKNNELIDPIEKILKIDDKELRQFVLQPYLNSGMKSSLLITFSDFGVYLVNKLLGLEKALQLRNIVSEDQNIKSILKRYNFNNRWQYTPNMKEIIKIRKS